MCVFCFFVCLCFGFFFGGGEVVYLFSAVSEINCFGVFLEEFLFVVVKSMSCGIRQTRAPMLVPGLINW